VMNLWANGRTAREKNAYPKADEWEF